MNLPRSVLAACLTLAMLLVPASAVAAQNPTGIVMSIYERANVDEDRLIPVGFPSYDEAKQCAWKGSCPEKKGISFVDLDISEPMEAYSERGWFDVRNNFVNDATIWYVCAYDGTGNILECWRDDERAGGMRGHLDGDERELRLMPIQSPATEWELSVFAE